MQIGINQNQDMKQRDPKPAATVILTRQHAGELQVYLLKRSVKSGFMAGSYVFPGGTVDTHDRNFQVWKTCVDLDSDEISQRLGGKLGKAEALAYGVAAIRETFEEAGVFLARKNKQNQQDLERVRKIRLSVNPAHAWFRKFVVSEGWTLALSELFRWSHWITPVLIKRRFDTRFFLASMPCGQVCAPDSRETVHGLWISPEKGLTGNLAGEIPLSPPTLITLHELLAYQNLRELKKEAAGRRWGQTLLSRLVPLHEGAVIVEPWDPIYNQKTIHFNGDELAQAVLPVGASFSRIWYNDGIWKPVRNER
jgi:8-oxo-dGTP pyrophosphatase MutT (NUDIX family)